MKTIAALLLLPFITAGYLAGLAWFGVQAGYANANFHMLNLWDGS
jgi:hypothetical protein